MSQLIGDLFTSDKIDLDYMADEGNQFTRFQKNYITEYVPQQKIKKKIDKKSQFSISGTER